jgi:hypothetical protein
MGTLFNQKPRESHEFCSDDVIFFLSVIENVMAKTGLSYEQVMRAYEYMQMERKNNLYHDNADVFDEQMMGFGELLQKLISLLNKE